MLILDGTTGCPVTTVTGTLPEANGGTGTTVGYSGFKNKIINGGMVIDQRYSGSSSTVAGNQNWYSIDRWAAFGTIGSKFSVQQNAGSVTPPTGFSNYFGVTSLSSYSVLSSDTFSVRQYIEGFNWYDLNWGTANAKTVTLSFWVYSSLTGTFGGSILNYAGTRSYPFSYTISSANTWEQKSITITGDTSGTWVGATNAGAVILSFGLGSGSTYSGTAGSWSTNQYYTATGATSVVGTNGATFYITGVQLEKGSTATSFDYRPYGTELALCQRYYEIGGNANSVQFCSTVSISTTYFTTIPFIVTKRASATVVNTNVNNNAMPTTASAATASATEIRNSRVSNGASANGYFGDSWTASAEL